MEQLSKGVFEANHDQIIDSNADNINHHKLAKLHQPVLVACFRKRPGTVDDEIVDYPNGIGNGIRDNGWHTEESF